ncbi:MAG: ABC transporter ATP-binding protein [Gaiellaceae bacterium MAG52_C11]|nr:ABC transporter ATP-binding protein [Candidatus Gaiellasilicea maunaloa]
MTLLEVRGLTRSFGGVRAVDEASFDVAAGSITALIGPNGAGKSTLFNIVSGFLRAERGTVRFAGRAMQRRTPHRIARAGLVRTFQTPRALTKLSVLENVLLAAPHHPGERLGRVFATPRAVRSHEAAAEREARRLLELVRLDRHADEYAGTLSGGERKLLDFARVLMTEPRLILLDEPMAGVNPTLGGQLLEHILELREERGVAFLLIEHDLDLVMRASDTVVVMNEGRILTVGTPDEVRRDERVVDAYLGAQG